MDKSVYNVLSRIPPGPGAYTTAVEELHRRFDKPRAMHMLYLENVTNLKPVKATQSALTELADILQDSIDGLVRLKQTDARYILTSLVTDCLPDKVKLAWEDSVEATNTVAPVQDLIAFIRRKADNPMYTDGAANIQQQFDKRPFKQQNKSKGSAHITVSQPASSPVTQSLPSPSSQQQRCSKPAGHKGSNQKSRNSLQSGLKYSCPLCSESHFCFSCLSFRKLTISKRKEHVSNHNLCQICLRPSHAPEGCRGNFNCRVCEGGHNTLLHVDSGSQAQPVVAGTANVVASDTTGSLAQNKLLMTCQVLATGPTGKSMPIRGLLDSGADISAVTSRVAKHLGLKKLNTTVAVSSYGDVINQPAAPTVSLVMDSIHAKPWQATIEAVVIDKITGTIPRSSASSVREHPGLQGVQLADPNFDLPGRVDLLLGIDILPQILKGGVSSGSVGVWQTTLGHAVMGTYEDAPKSIGDRQAAVQVAVQQPESPGHSPDDLALVRFWEVEQPSSKVAPLTQEELSIQNH